MNPPLGGRKARFQFYCCLAGFLLAALMLSRLGAVEHHPYLFSLLYILSFLFLVGMIKTVPLHWSEKDQWLLIAALAITTRIAFFAYPASNDVNRYIWEGYILNRGFNPYLIPPDSPLLKPYVIDIWHEISHKNLTACYPPLALLLFRLAAAVSPTIPCFKGLMLAFDLASIWILVLLLRSYGLPPRRLAFYALNPLVLVFVAGEGHLDVMQVFFILLCFYLLRRNREAPAFFSLGCGILTKYFAILVAPLLLNAKNWKNVVCLVGALALFILPFLRTGTEMFSSLLFFGSRNAYNDSIAILLRGIFGQYAVLASLVLLASVILVIFLIVQEPLRSSYLALGCALLLLGTLNPWYLVLIAPFLSFFPSRAWLYLQMAVVPALYLQYHTAYFYRSYWITLLEYLPFYGLLLWDTYHDRRMQTERRFDRVSELSAVIPTLNEAESIDACLRVLQNEERISEVILADGGSIDETRDIGKSRGAKIVLAPRGRGSQIKAAVDHCTGDVIMVVHSDCLIVRGAANRVVAALDSRPECIGGALAMEYIESAVGQRFTAWLNNTRSRWTGISFGDQAQFFRKEALPLIGGYPDLMLMEDVELSLRLKEVAPVCFISKGIMVSRRRWERIGFLANSWKVLRICFTYLVRRRLKLAGAEGRRFYDLYYENGDR